MTEEGNTMVQILICPGFVSAGAGHVRNEMQEGYGYGAH